jgi:membrane-bound ClpP family serine protease
MRKLILAVTLGGLILMGAQNASAEEESSLPTVDVQEVSGLLDEIQAQAMEDAIERSSGEGSQALVFQMNTRGSVLSRERVAVLLERVAAAKVPVAIWVGPSGSRLYVSRRSCLLLPM